MSDAYCRLDLIYPPWLAWVVLGLGAVVLVLGIRRLAGGISDGTYTWPISFSFGNIYPVLLALGGLFIFGAGLLALTALSQQAFARRLVDYVPSLVAEADDQVTGDYNDEPLSRIVGQGGSGYYAVRLAPDAKDIKINGKYEGLCQADLLTRICRNNGDKLTCLHDPPQKLLRICLKSNDAACRNGTL